MANEKRLIDADTLTDTIENIDWYHVGSQGNLVRGARSDSPALYKADDVYGAIENAPTVDAVEVMRCKDCKHFMTDVLGQQVCNRTFMMFHMESDDFCSYGEKREVE